MRVLLIGNRYGLVRSLASALQMRGFTPLHMAGVDGSAAVLRRTDVVLIDLNRPAELAECKKVRAVSDLPIIVAAVDQILGARSVGPRWGADAYLVKPIDIERLAEELRTVRRTVGRIPDRDSMTVDGLTLDFAERTATIAGTTAQLSKKQFHILALITEAKGGVCPRGRLVNEIWGGPWDGAQKTLNVHMAMLRSKLGRPGLIETVHGVGYRLTSAKDAGGFGRESDATGAFPLRMAMPA